MTKSFKKVSALLLGLTMLGGVFGGALLAHNPEGGLLLMQLRKTQLLLFLSS